MRILKNQRALDFLKVYNIPTLDYTEISGGHCVLDKLPCVLKVDSPKIFHKSDKKGVHIIHNKEHAHKTFNKLRKHGTVLHQQHVNGHHFVLQVLSPPKGRKSILIGLSGISTDIHDDFSVRQCPIKAVSANKMLKELISFSHVSNFNNKSTRLSVLEETLIYLSEIAVKEKIKTLEIDPFIINNKFGGVADAKIILHGD